MRKGNFRAQCNHGRGLFKGIQPFEITIATSQTQNTYTLPAPVVFAKSVCKFNNFVTPHTGTTLAEFMPRVELSADGTTVTVTRNTSNATHTVTVRGAVIEFKPEYVESVQQDTVTIGSGSASGTKAITAVDRTRSLPFYLGVTNTGTTTSANAVHCNFAFQDNSTIVANRNAASSTVTTLGFCIVQFVKGVLKSVQAISSTSTSTNTEDTDTINTVDPARTILLYNGVSSATATINNFFHNLKLTNATTVTKSRAGTSAASRTINYIVAQFTPTVIKRIQRDIVSIASADSADKAITAVTVAKAFVNFLGSSASNTTVAEQYSTVELQATTNVRGKKNTAGTSTAAAAFEVIESY